MKNSLLSHNAYNTAISENYNYLEKTQACLRAFCLFVFVLQVIIKSWCFKLPFHGMTGEVPAAKRWGTILQ